MEKVLSKQAVCEVLGGISLVTLWRWERNGDFPPRRRIGAGRVGWLQSEVDAWLKHCPKLGVQIEANEEVGEC